MENYKLLKTLHDSYDKEQSQMVLINSFKNDDLINIIKPEFKIYFHFTIKNKFYHDKQIDDFYNQIGKFSDVKYKLKKHKWSQIFIYFTRAVQNLIPLDDKTKIVVHLNEISRCKKKREFIRALGYFFAVNCESSNNFLVLVSDTNHQFLENKIHRDVGHLYLRTDLIISMKEH